MTNFKTKKLKTEVLNLNEKPLTYQLKSKRVATEYPDSSENFTKSVKKYSYTSIRQNEEKKRK